jgi:hypothetical protein
MAALEAGERRDSSPSCLHSNPSSRPQDVRKQLREQINNMRLMAFIAPFAKAAASESLTAVYTRTFERAAFGFAKVLHALLGNSPTGGRSGRGRMPECSHACHARMHALALCNKPLLHAPTFADVPLLPLYARAALLVSLDRLECPALDLPPPGEALCSHSPVASA